MNGIRPGETCVITHDIGAIFYQGEQVVVEQIDPDPQDPQFMYLVHSSQDLSWYRLSAGDLAPLGAQVYAQPKQERFQRKAAKPKEQGGWKKALIVLLIVLLIAGAGFAVVYFLFLKKSDNSTVNRNEQETREDSKSTTPASATAVYGTPKVVKAQLDKVQIGMSYEEVVGIFGGPGVVKAEAGTQGSPGYQISYAWDGEEAGWYVFCTFVDGKLTGKTSSGF